uniref:Uncharacterized protein n=1 Tax=viral metagenome TaxID=1070528 RepID=A0A6C0IS51_9ZZZZ
MIATQRIKSTTAKPVEIDGYESINVLKWNNSKWKNFSPYLLKTDGNEICANNGSIIFENFYQGCKVYDVVYENKVYPSKYHMNNPKYLWWEFIPKNLSSGDVILKENKIDYDLFYNWRNDLWNCANPIRYPNKINRRKNTKFSLCIDKNGNETRYNYIESRKHIYFKEYVRLVKKFPEYNKLLDKLKKGENIMICEVDVPAINKKGNYGLDCDENNVCHMSIEKLEVLLNDPSEAFGHGLCLAYSLLLDMNNLNIIF